MHRGRTRGMASRCAASRQPTFRAQFDSRRCAGSTPPSHGCQHPVPVSRQQVCNRRQLSSHPARTAPSPLTALRKSSTGREREGTGEGTPRSGSGQNGGPLTLGESLVSNAIGSLRSTMLLRVFLRCLSSLLNWSVKGSPCARSSLAVSESGKHNTPSSPLTRETLRSVHL